MQNASLISRNSSLFNIRYQAHEISKGLLQQCHCALTKKTQNLIQLQVHTGNNNRMVPHKELPARIGPSILGLGREQHKIPMLTV